MPETESQFNNLADILASSISYTVDAYGWILPALFLTMLFFAAVVLLSWIAEDLPFELEVFTAPRSIFRWVRERWQLRSTR